MKIRVTRYKNAIEIAIIDYNKMNEMNLYHLAEDVERYLKEKYAKTSRMDSFKKRLRNLFKFTR